MCDGPAFRSAVAGSQPRHFRSVLPTSFCFNVRRMVHVRLAVAADGDAIGEVEVETWRVAYAGLIPAETIAGFDAEPRKQMWRDGLAREHKAGTAVFVAEGDAGVVGFAWVGASRDEVGSAELYAIYLHPASWGTGVGRALLERAEESMRESGFVDALLWVIDGNERAARFYEAAGWFQDGRKIAEIAVFAGVDTPQLRYRKRL